MTLLRGDEQYGDVTVRGAREAMKLRAQSGTIEVSRVSGKALDATHSFEAAYGDVSLAWPRSAAPRYRIESTGGSVRSDFPGTADEFGSRTTISSRDGRGDLVAISQSGSVRLKME